MTREEIEKVADDISKIEGITLDRNNFYDSFTILYEVLSRMSPDAANDFVNDSLMMIDIEEFNNGRD